MSEKPLPNWKTLARRAVLTPNRFLTVELHRVELPDGRVIEDWPWLVTPEYVNVLARTREGQFVCIRQTKYAVKDGTTLSVVGGHIEPGEAPLAAAQRELCEEAGYAAPTWKSLHSFVVDSNRGSGRAHFFLARDAVPVARAPSDDLEEQELLLLSRAQLEAALDRGAFKVLAWNALIALALRELDRA